MTKQAGGDGGGGGGAVHGGGGGGGAVHSSQLLRFNYHFPLFKHNENTKDLRHADNIKTQALKRPRSIHKR